MTVEPLSEGSEGETGFVVIKRLMGALMDDKPVKTAGHFHISGRLQILGSITPSVSSGSKRLCSNELLAIDMGYGSGFTDIGTVCSESGCPHC